MKSALVHPISGAPLYAWLISAIVFFVLWEYMGRTKTRPVANTPLQALANVLEPFVRLFFPAIADVLKKIGNANPTGLIDDSDLKEREK